MGRRMAGQRLSSWLHPAPHSRCLPLHRHLRHPLRPRPIRRRRERRPWPMRRRSAWHHRLTWFRPSTFHRPQLWNHQPTSCRPGLVFLRWLLFHPLPCSHRRSLFHPSLCCYLGWVFRHCQRFHLWPMLRRSSLRRRCHFRQSRSSWSWNCCCNSKEQELPIQSTISNLNSTSRLLAGPSPQDPNT